MTDVSALQKTTASTPEDIPPGFYGKYAKVRNAAWQVLLDYKVTTLPFDVAAIAREMGIVVAKFHEVDVFMEQLELHQSDGSMAGMALQFGAKWYILYDDYFTATHDIRFTVAHELGHILLGHEMDVMETEFYRMRYKKKRKPERERQADMFASRMLAPACVLAALNIRTMEDIMIRCGLPQQEAKKRSERMAVLYERNKFGAHPLERQVMRQFQPFVESLKDS